MLQSPAQPTSLGLSALHPTAADYSVRAVNLILAAAVDYAASDLHLHPRADGWEVLLRIDGVLSVVDFLRRGPSSDPVTRLMVLAALPTYRSSQPMEGRLQWESDCKELSMRLGIFPTVHGPRAVVRVLRKDQSFDQIESLGLADDVTRLLIQASEQTDGAILLSGPAGSGKTTTMYAVLRRIAAQRPRRSVMTIEDPVESVIDSISQSELDPSAGMTLASALRSAVRQDSEVLLVSEIRDPETAEAALQASLTGHLVFSSLHATDIAAALRRLVQLGAPVHAIRSGVRAIVSQRLLRRLCTDCQGTGSDPSGRTCSNCLGTGFRGRIAVAQAIRLDGYDPVGDALAEALETGQTLAAMRAAATEAGGIDLAARAQRYVEAGLTSTTEVYRVLGTQDRGA